MPNELVKASAVSGRQAALPAMDRPNKLPGVSISTTFRQQFPESSEIGHERHGEYDMHIDFDDGKMVGCWSLYGDGSQEGEILDEADAAAVRNSCRREKATNG